MLILSILDHDFTAEDTVVYPHILGQLLQRKDVLKHSVRLSDVIHRLHQFPLQLTQRRRRTRHETSSLPTLLHLLLQTQFGVAYLH